MRLLKRMDFRNQNKYKSWYKNVRLLFIIYYLHLFINNLNLR